MKALSFLFAGLVVFGLLQSVIVNDAPSTKTAFAQTVSAKRAGAKTGALRVVELNTFAFVCNGQRHELIAPLPAGARVRQAAVWLGAYDYANADIIYSLEHIDTNGNYNSIAKGGWDHYLRGGGLDAQMHAYTYAPDWIEIGAGEQLALEAQCNPMDADTQTKKAHEIIMLYYLAPVK